MNEVSYLRLTGQNCVSSKLFLKKCLLEDVVNLKESKNVKALVTVSNETTIFDAIAEMNKNDVTSIVIFSLHPTTRRKEYIAIVNCLDIVSWFTWKRKEADSARMLVSELAKITEETKMLWKFPVSEPLDSVVQPFMQGVHAVIAKRNSKEKKKVYVSQWDVVKFIFLCREFIKEKEFFKCAIKDTKIFGRLSKAVSIECKQRLHDGFELMCKKEFRGIAVVNKEGQLLSNLKVSHARHVLTRDMEAEIKTVDIETFLKKIGEPYGVGEPVNAVAFSASIEDMLKIVVETHVHRLWILDSNQIPVYVLTLSDLIKEIFLLDFYKEYDVESASAEA